jgi:hypothetical protein
MMTYYFERIGNIRALDRNLMHGLIMKHIELLWRIDIYDLNKYVNHFEDQGELSW